MRNFLAGTLTGVLLSAGTAGLLGVKPDLAASHREPQFENAAVKVWRTVVEPGDPTPLHRHDHPRVIIALSDGTMDLIDQSGKHERHAWQADHAYWLPAMAPGVVHQDVNPGKTPLTVMVVELEREP